MSKTNKTVILVVLCLLSFFGLGYYLKHIKTSRHQNLKVVLKAKVLKDDVFQLFYSEDIEERFSVKKSVYKEIVGDEKTQRIIFTLPELVRLDKLRLDIGTNQNQGIVEIEEITFDMDHKAVSFNASNFDQLFRANNYIKKIKEGSYKGLPSKAKGKTKPFYDPYFVARQSSEGFQSLKSQNITRYPFLISGFVILILFVFVYRNLETIRLVTESIFVFIFLLILVAPFFQGWLRFVEPAKNLEKRTLALKPEFGLNREYPRKFEQYFDDNFGFRNHLINWGGAYRTKLFRSSRHTDLVKFGKKDWLFYNRIDGKIFKSYTHTNLLSQDTLQKVVSKWEKNKKKYNELGAKYFLAFWPNKHTIYPEYLPNSMKSQIKDTISRIDQILHYLKKTKSPVSLFDPRPFLLEEKASNQLYHKFDTHWNNYGAYIAYRSFFSANMKELGIQPKNIDQFTIEWSDFQEGELIEMLGVKNDGYFNERAPIFEFKDKQQKIEFLSIEGFPKQTKRTRNQNCGNKLKVVVFRDSFTTKLIQFFSLHFYEVTYIWGHSERFIDELKPDVIIEGYVERSTGEKIQ